MKSSQRIHKDTNKNEKKTRNRGKNNYLTLFWLNIIFLAFLFFHSKFSFTLINVTIFFSFQIHTDTNKYEEEKKKESLI
ncbi:unnamed protein product [Trifolium pratense]|uniref:Uncharacterized protein n=1 Tax=Trifolium pratense TaxID=57577 RepID=A0ACB0M017_TRIPR|nr:unnamed protein product [Trifolium pratense]